MTRRRRRVYPRSVLEFLAHDSLLAPSLDLSISPDAPSENNRWRGETEAPPLHRTTELPAYGYAVKSKLTVAPSQPSWLACVSII